MFVGEAASVADSVKLSSHRFAPSDMALACVVVADGVAAGMAAGTSLPPSWLIEGGSAIRAWWGKLCVGKDAYAVLLSRLHCGQQ